jgi:hypothetical protein
MANILFRLSMFDALNRFGMFETNGKHTVSI